MRVLMLVTDLEMGGTPVVVREVSTRLRRLMHVEVACLGGWGPVATQIDERGVGVTALDARSAWDVRVVGRLAQLVRAGDFDVVMSFLLHANAAAALATLGSGVRLIQSIQTTQRWPRWHWSVQRMIAPLAEAVVVPSASVARVARDWAGVPASRVHVIPNGVDAAAFDVVRKPAGGWDVGFIGRLDPVKRVPDLVEAMRLLPDARLHLFGDGPERRNIDPSVATLHGTVPAAEALSRLDLLVLPSEAEGFGLVLIEAMAAGVPVVATDVPGIRDVVRHEQNGLLVPPRDPPALAAAIRRMRDDASLRRSLVAHGLADVMARYRWDSIIPRYERFLVIP